MSSKPVWGGPLDAREWPPQAYLEEAPVAPHRRLRQRVGPEEAQVQGPDARVLCDGQGPEGAVKRAAGVRDTALVHQELAVVQPQTGHLEVWRRGVL